MKKKLSIIIFLIAMMPTLVLAHPGRTDSNGCHYCKTNCDQYGLSYGEYHCHNSGSTSNSSSNNSSQNNSSVESNGSTNNSNPPTSIQEPVKSSDNTLKKITIDGKELLISDTLYYSTTREKISIEVLTNDSKATYEIKNNSSLAIGENLITIEVTAEDGTVKSYNLTVNREKILSSNTDIKIIIDDEEVIFDNYQATIYLPSSSKTINFNYILSDPNAKTNIDDTITKITHLKTGDNNLNIKVTAEDGTEQEYEIIIHKYSKFEEFITLVLSFALLGGIGYGIYWECK